MLRYLAGKGGAACLVLLGASVIVFLAVRLVPGDPVTTLLGSAGLRDPAAVERFREQYGLDRPLIIQYWAWLSHMAAGEFGRSVVSGESVAEIVGRRAGPSFLLGGLAAAVGLTTGVLWGVVAAYVTGPLGRVLRATPTFFLVIPTFSIGLALAFLFAVVWRVLPASGIASPLGGGGVLETLRHAVLPTASLSFLPAAITARITFAAIGELQQEDFVRTARASGIPVGRITLRHILPNALLPVITNGGVLASALITNAVLIEAVFSWPGIGTMMVSAVQARDYPVVQAGILLVAVTYVTISLVVDALYAVVDPRIGSGARAEA